MSSEERNDLPVGVVLNPTSAREHAEDVSGTALSSTRRMSLQEIAQARPQTIELFVKAMEMAAKQIRASAFALVDAEDFILNRDKEGNETAMLSGPGAQKIAPLLGVTVTNLRGPDGIGVSQPVIEDGRAVIIGDIHSRVLATTLEAVRAERGEDEQFIGRTARPGDLRAAANTLLLSKGVRMLLGLTRIPLAVLRDHKVDVNRCRRGHGYGSSGTRQRVQETGGTADAGDLEARAKALWSRMLEAASGDERGAHDILTACSSFETADGKKIGAKDWKHLIGKGNDKWYQSTRKRFEAEHEAPEPGGDA